MSYFIKLNKPWRDNKKGDVITVGKSSRKAIVDGGIGVRVGSSDASDPVPEKPKEIKKPKKAKKKLWGI